MQVDQEWRDKRKTVLDAVEAGHAQVALRHARGLLAFGKATDIQFCANAFKKLTPALIQQGHKSLKTYIVRSVTVEPILPALHVAAVLSGYVLDLEVGGYGSYMDEMLNPGAGLGCSRADLVLVLLDTEEIAGQLSKVCSHGSIDEIKSELEASVIRVGQMLHGYRASNQGRVVLQGCMIPTATSLGLVGDANIRHSYVQVMRELNSRLAELCSATPDCLFYDVDHAAAQFGREIWLDRRLFLSSRLAVAPQAFRTYSRGLMRTASVLFRAPRKVLCTDLDNTLWGGILGEDGPSGIATGSSFPGNCYLAYQRYLKELSARGILLAVSSKNNPGDVDEAFRVRAADLALTLDDFVSRKVGWNEKAEALREIATELSLGLDSLVFVDDSPAECAAIRHQMPEVAVVEVWAHEPWHTVKMLADEWFFDSAVVTKDDRNRADDYKAQAQRAALNHSATSRDEFLKSLGIVCTFLNAEHAPLERFVQLLAKTSQFNLTTRRHSLTEVMEFVTDPRCQAVAVRARDRFGDAGVIGLALTRQLHDSCWIDSLLLSCRVIGRGIETALLAHVAAEAVTMGSKWLVGEYIETKKNAPCKGFYTAHGFESDVSLSETSSRFYKLDLTQSTLASPSWLTSEGPETV